MATRFYFPRNDSVASNISPSFDTGWEQTGQALRLQLPRTTTLSSLQVITIDSAKTVPITTTQDVLADQFISEPIPAQFIVGTFSLVIKVNESNAGANATLAVVVKVVSQDGGTLRGTLFSNFNQDTEFGTTTSTRIVNAQAVTALATQPGDRIVVEIGAHLAAPTVATTWAIASLGYNATDYALTSGLTTVLNPWCEFSQNIWSSDTNNYQFVKAGDGISVSEKIR